MDFRIRLDDRALRATMSNMIAAGEDFSAATIEIAELLQRIVEDAFAHEADPATGSPWPALSETTEARRRKSGHVGIGGAKKLQVRRNLLKSILPDHDRSTAVVGTNVKYAATQHFGAAKGEFGRTKRGAPIPWGDIPPRPFFGISPTHERAIADIVANHVTASWHD